MRRSLFYATFDFAPFTRLVFQASIPTQKYTLFLIVLVPEVEGLTKVDLVAHLVGYTGRRKPRRSTLDWSTRFLRERWEAGEHNGTVLWEELRVQGYSGSMRSVYRRLAIWRDRSGQRGSPSSTGFVARSPLEDVTPGQIIGWMVTRPETLTPEAQEQLDRITQMDSTLAQARELTHRFLDLIRHHSGEGLDSWLKDVRASSVRQLLPFARSIERDKAAILAGLTLPYSTGPVEGHINRLKLLKRQAYGRAGLAYLQHRFLSAA